jgi:hypothetical protein
VFINVASIKAPVMGMRLRTSVSETIRRDT